MPTNDERRRLAGNMRVFDVVSDAHGRFWLNGTLFGMDITTRSKEDLRTGMKRLASFIDPDIIPDNTDGTERPLSEPKVDRDALIDLSYKMEDDALDSCEVCDEYWICSVSDDSVCPYSRLLSYVASIWEAVGA